MDLQLRLAALSKLMATKSEAVDRRLAEEFGRVEGLLLHGSEYDELSDALETLTVLAPRFHLAVLPLLESFVRSVPTRPLNQGGSPLSQSKLRYRSASTLICEAIDVAARVRYLHMEKVVDFLLELSRASDAEVRSKAERTLEALAEFNLDVFYGEYGIGAEPQARIVTHLTEMGDAQLVDDAGVILRVLRGVLSPSMEGTSWTHRNVTIRRGAIVSDGGVSQMREAAIALLKRMYPLNAAIDFRKNVLRTLDAATRRERQSDDLDTSAMFERDAIVVLNFLRGLVPTEALPLVQTIEHQAYWNYYHSASPPIESAALAVRDALASHVEYQMYKQLIGFEGIFGEWEELRRSEAAWDYSDTNRYAAARQYVEDIDDARYEQWRDRILEFSKTRSNDLATFPVYYEFLESIGRDKPELALELVTAYQEAMTPFLIALVRGLWASTRQADVESVVQRWITDGVNLTAIAKSLYKVGASRLDTLSAVTARSATLDDRNALINVMGVAASLHSEGSEWAKPIFMQALRELAKRNEASWTNAIWFSRDLRSLIGAMDPSERVEVLSSMASLPKLDYQAEEVLFVIAEHDLQSVLKYLMERLREARVRAVQGSEFESSGFDNERFESIPYQLHKLNEQLAKAPEALVSALRRDFDEEVRALFTYRGARLIKSVFSTFGEPLEGLLMGLVESGDQDDIDFVLAILRAYDGSAPILQVCKAIIKSVPEGSKTWNELAAAIESTGVVSGEYGMVQAFERKRTEISVWKDDEDVRVRAFAQWLIKSLDYLIDQERQRADEGLALRKYRSGGDKEEQ